MQSDDERDSPPSYLPSGAPQQPKTPIGPGTAEVKTGISPSSGFPQTTTYGSHLRSSPLGPVASFTLPTRHRYSALSDVTRAYANTSLAASNVSHSVLNLMATEIAILEFHCTCSINGVTSDDAFPDEIYDIVEARKALAKRVEPDFCERRLHERRRE